MISNSLEWSERNTEKQHRNWYRKYRMLNQVRICLACYQTKHSFSNQASWAAHWIGQYKQFSICYTPLSWLNPMKRRSFSPDAVELLEAWPSRDMFMIVASVWPYSCRFQRSEDSCAKEWIETKTKMLAENWKRNGRQARSWALLSEVVFSFAQTQLANVSHVSLPVLYVTSMCFSVKLLLRF
jgi:hypothetical protein